METGERDIKYTLSYLKTDLGDADDERTIPDMLLHWRNTKPHQEAVVFVSVDGKREAVTWQELHQNSILYAEAFLHAGIGEGDVVAMTVRGQAQWLYIHFGLMTAGAIPFPLVFTYKDGSDVTAVLNKIEKCTTIIIDPEYDATTWGILKSLVTSLKSDGLMHSEQIPSLRRLICTSAPPDHSPVLLMGKVVETWIQYQNTVKEGSQEESKHLPQLSPRSVALLLQTSGSTGVPKAVAHSHNGLVTVASSFLLGKVDKWEIVFNDRPFTWLGGWPLQLVSGDTRVCRSGFSGEPPDHTQFIIDTIIQERCTLLGALPPTLQSLINRQVTLNSLLTICNFFFVEF